MKPIDPVTLLCLWILFVCAITAPFECTERGRRVTARILDRWF